MNHERFVGVTHTTSGGYSRVVTGLSSHLTWLL